jgi:hypothetical protein
MKARKFEVWVRSAPADAKGFVIALKPPVFRRNPEKIKALAFVSHRIFISPEDAKGMADYLFGKLNWKVTKSGWHVACVALSATPSA